MFSCLVFLTGVNFFLYGTAKQTDISVQVADDLPTGENGPPCPIEEESAGNSISILEEYMAVEWTPQFSLSQPGLIYHMPDAARLAIVHFELISPPPDL